MVQAMASMVVQPLRPQARRTLLASRAAASRVVADARVDAP